MRDTAYVVRNRRQYESVYSTPYFSPDDEAFKIPMGFMKRCETFCDIAVYSITHKEIADAIIENSRRLPRMRVVMDKVQAAGVYSQFDYLKDNGVKVIHDTQTGIMHLKVAIDWARSRGTKGRIKPNAVLLGSYNWTRSATEKNRENQLILRIKKVVLGHIYVFEDIWEANGGYDEYPETRL